MNSTGFETNNTGAFIRKDPESVLDYTINWANWLSSGDTIATSTYTVPTGITADSVSNTTTTATVKLSSGTAGTNYVIKNSITTGNGLTCVRRFTVKVQEMHL